MIRKQLNREIFLELYSFTYILIKNVIEVSLPVTMGYVLITNNAVTGRQTVRTAAMRKDVALSQHLHVRLYKATYSSMT